MYYRLIKKKKNIWNQLIYILAKLSNLLIDSYVLYTRFDIHK